VYDVLTVIIGGSTAGYSLMPRYVYPITPNSTIAIDITIASTGLLILNDDKLINSKSF
jgi:hypothetical protein